MSNNSLVRLEETPVSIAQRELLKEREGKLVKILEAIRAVKETKCWSTLKVEIFDGLSSKLERELRDEARKVTPDPNKLNRIAGQLEWAERFSDLNKLDQRFQVELQGIRQRYGKTE